MTPPSGPLLPIMGGKVVLTALLDGDIDRVVEACSTEQARRWLDTPWPYARTDAAQFVREFAPAGWRGEHRERVWAIRERLRGELSGVISFRADSNEVGFWLHPDAQGKGLMADAVRAVIGHAEGCLDAPEVTWTCYDGNLDSMRVAAATGFAYLGTREGTQRGEPVVTHRAVRAATPPADAQPWPDLGQRRRS